MLEHEFIYADAAEQFVFYRIPKALVTNDRYKSVSDSAKILYGLMLDRVGLSLKNGWYDEQRRVFIYFTLEDVLEHMNCGHNKGVKIMAELDNIGLIARVKQGLGRPTIIYVKCFSNDATYPAPTPALPLPNESSQPNYAPGNPDFLFREVRTSEKGTLIILSIIILSLIIIFFLLT